MATVGGKVTSRLTSPLPVELGQFTAEVRAHVPHDLLHPLQMDGGEQGVLVLGEDDQVDAQDFGKLYLSVRISL
jgi:hypothetical protein